MHQSIRKLKGMRGKDTCKKLKEIRLQIARANGIKYAPRECTHKGPCLGTCPMCEQEVNYLERMLKLRRQLGKAVAVAGVALSVLHPTTAEAQEVTTQQPAIKDTVSLEKVPVIPFLYEGEKGVVWRGRLIDKTGEPLLGASIRRVEEKKKTTLHTLTDLDGCFAIEAPLGSVIEFIYIGYKSAKVTVAQENAATVCLEDSDELLGDIIIVGATEKRNYDDVYGHDH
jgi:hypothetical protein